MVHGGLARVGAVTIVVVLVLLTTGSTMASGAKNTPPGAPTQLTVDDDAAPLAVTDDPAFGWVVNDPDRGERQSAYEIVVTSALRSGGAPIIDTGRVSSAQQSYVHVPGLRAKLQPDQPYRWTVRTWDAAGAQGAVSAPASFDTGLRDQDWKASWIRRPGAEHAGLEDYSLFRKEVTLGASPIVRARVDASAGQHYELRVNGARLAFGPSYAYPDEQYYEATDVTKAVVAGRPNAFAFITFWGQPAQGRPASVPALIAHITVDHADGTREVITTDATWRTHTGMWIQGPPRNDEGDFVEHIDERRAPVGWDRPGFDDSSWTPAAVLGPHPTAPFTHLVAARTHIVEHNLRPAKVTRLPDGATVADFGSVVSATPDVHVARGVAGEHVVLVGGYELDPNGHVSRTRGIQDTDMTWQFDERAGRQDLLPFGYLAFRYLEFDGAGERMNADTMTVEARHAALPDENAAAFDTSNATLNAVWNLARHSALYDVQEQFLDTPTREKGPFLGDSYDVSQATMAAFDERNLTYQALRDFARSQKRYWPDGRVNVVYPNGDGKRDIPDATETYPVWVWRAYMTTGNRDDLAAFYPVARNITDYVAHAIDPATGLVTRLPGGGEDYMYGAVDWPPWMRYGYDMNTAARTMINVYAVDDFERVAQMAQALGRPATEITTQQQRAARLTAAINARLRRPDGIYIDGLEPSGAQSTHASQQANAWALASGIVPAAATKTVANYTISLGSAMGVVYYRVLLDALHAAGRDDAIVAILTNPRIPGYAQILKRGATFTWESWIAPDIGDSESHGWGSTVLAVLQDDILGARTTAPGAATLDVRVPETSVTRASGRVVTQRGLVGVRWTFDRPTKHTTLALTVPVNATAVVHLDAPDLAHVNDGGGPVTNDPGITSAVAGRDGTVVLTVGSGDYQFDTSPPTRATHGTTSTSSSSSTKTALLIGFGALVLLGIGVGLALAMRRTNRAS